MSAAQNPRRLCSLRRLRKHNRRFRKTLVHVVAVALVAQRIPAACYGASVPVTEPVKTATTATTRRCGARVTERMLPSMYRTSFMKCSLRQVFRLKRRLADSWSRGSVMTSQGFAYTPIHALLIRLEQLLLQPTQSAVTLFLRAANINPRVPKVENCWRTNLHT